MNYYGIAGVQNAGGDKPNLSRRKSRETPTIAEKPTKIMRPASMPGSKSVYYLAASRGAPGTVGLLRR